MDLDKVIEKRKSVRSFKKSKKPDYRKILFAVESAFKAPCAGNIPSLRYILVSDKDKIKALSDASEQPFFKDVFYAVVVCSDKTLLEKSYYDRAEMYSRQQAGASIENFLLKITDLKLSSCWIGAFCDFSVKKILNIPDNIIVEAILPVGFELLKKERKNRIDFSNYVYFDKYKNKYMIPLSDPRD